MLYHETELPSVLRPIFHCMDIPHFLYSSVNGHVGSLHILAIVTNAAVNMELTFRRENNQAQRGNG